MASRTSCMLLAGACVVLALAFAAHTASAVDCGSLGELPLSGCKECTPVNITKPGKGGNRTEHEHDGKDGGKRLGRGLLHGGGGGWPLGPVTLPNCTACDTDNNYALLTWPKHNSTNKHNSTKKNHTEPFGTWPTRCGCAPGYGVNITGNASITIGNKTKSIPVFACVACGANEVPLVPGSNVVPVKDAATGAWKLVLKSSLPAGAKAEAAGAKKDKRGDGKKKSDSAGSKEGEDKQGGGKKGGGKKGGGKKGGSDNKKPWAIGPYVPGACVPCPVGSQKTINTCV